MNSTRYKPITQDVIERFFSTEILYSAANISSMAKAYGPELVNSYYKGKTALHIAIYLGNSAILETLIKAGADMLLYDDSGLNAMHHATINDCPQSVGLLKEHGCDVNTKTLQNGHTPLHLLARIPPDTLRTPAVLAEILLHNLNAQVNILSNAGLTPLTCALNNPEGQAISRILASNGGRAQWEKVTQTLTADFKAEIIQLGQAWVGQSAPKISGHFNNGTTAPVKRVALKLKTPSKSI